MGGRTINGFGIARPFINRTPQAWPDGASGRLNSGILGQPVRRVGGAFGGIGGGFGGGFGGGIGYSREQPPFFAMYPPVYYNDIVSRNYGVSPFATPPGVAPIEGTVAPQPVIIKNEFVPEPAPADSKKDEPKTDKKDGKSAFIGNPYFAPRVADANSGLL
jgi:hypothetical protein